MCGAESDLVSAVVEGSMLKVCKRCSCFGNVIEVSKSLEVVKTPRSIVVEEPVNFVVEGAGNIVKGAREERGLKQSQLGKMVGEKESVVHKIENGMMKPTLVTAGKFERILDVKLIEGYQEPDKKNVFSLGDKRLTIGDLIKLKKK